MDGEASERQPKQERLRTRWTASLDKIFADLVVEQIQLGNRPNNVFDKKTWNLIRDEFNKQTDLNFNNNQLRKHLDVLRTRYYNVKSTFDQNDFVMDDPCSMAFDLWEDIGVYFLSPVYSLPTQIHCDFLMNLNFVGPSSANYAGDNQNQGMSHLRATMHNICRHRS